MFTLNTGDAQLIGLAYDGNQLFTIDTGDNPDQLEKIDIKDGATIYLMNNGVSCPADGLSDIATEGPILWAAGSSNLYQFHPDGGTGKVLSITAKGFCFSGEFIYVCT
jgi:hypothetical protein